MPPSVTEVGRRLRASRLHAISTRAVAASPSPGRVRKQGPLTLEGTCSFPVLLQPTAPDVMNFLVFSDGEIFGSGPSVGTATNLDTGKTVKINMGAASRS